MLLAIFIHKSALLMHLFLSEYGNTFYAICIRIADLHRRYGSRISAYGNVHLLAKCREINSLADFLSFSGNSVTSYLLMNINDLMLLPRILDFKVFDLH